MGFLWVLISVFLGFSVGEFAGVSIGESHTIIKKMSSDNPIITAIQLMSFLVCAIEQI